MKRILIILILFVPLSCQAASLITNGNFEDNDFIDDITETPPKGWDVNIPDNFGGDIGDSWSTHGDYSLTLFSNGFFTAFVAGQKAMISQEVDLTDANEIILDIHLNSFQDDWDGNNVTAFINIDNSPTNIWQSGQTDEGIYYDVNIPVDSYTGLHTLYLGLRVDVTDTLIDSYWAQWDFVKFDTYCGGFGYLASDLNRDCYVNFGDLKIMVKNWLRDDLIPADDYLDLDPDGYIDLFDFVILANEWMQCTDSQWGDCVEVPLDLTADINMDGIVNFIDYGILSANRPVPTDEKADIDESGTVDYNDIKMMNFQWLQKNWLYEN